MAAQAVPERYEVVGRLGKGGMGIVYRARDTRLLREVALKVVSAEAERGDAALCFHREARAMAALRHANIVTIYDYSGPDERPLYMSMELVDGTTLSQLVSARGPLPEPVVLAILQAVASALAHAHGQGVIHRDIKPSNVMLDGTGRVLLLDFGIAKSYEDPELFGKTLAGQNTALRGTPEYMAPEQILQRELGPHTDIFSLGTLTYVLATASSPFRDVSMVDVMRHVARREFVPLPEAQPGLSSELYDLVDDCLQTETARRPSAADVERRAGVWLHAHGVVGPQGLLAAYLAGKDYAIVVGGDVTAAPTDVVDPSEVRRQWSKTRRPAARADDDGGALAHIPAHLRASPGQTAAPAVSADALRPSPSGRRLPVTAANAATSAAPPAAAAADDAPAASETPLATTGPGRWIALGIAALVAIGVAVVAFQYRALHEAAEAGPGANPAAPILVAIGSPAPIDPTRAAVRFSIRPWARVYIDDQFVGVTPDDLIDVLVMPGIRLFTFEHPGWPKYSKRLPLTAGERQELKIDLQPRR